MMVLFSKLFNKLYDLVDKGPLRALSLVSALVLAGCVLWFAPKTYSLEVWQGLVIIWAVCTGVIFGVGLRPRRLRWRTVFTPLPAMLIIVASLIYFLN